MGRLNAEQNRAESKELSRTPNTTKQCPNTENVQDPNKTPNTLRIRTPDTTSNTNKPFPNTEHRSAQALFIIPHFSRWVQGREVLVPCRVSCGRA